MRNRANRHGPDMEQSINMEHSTADPTFFNYHAPEPSYSMLSQGLPSHATDFDGIYPAHEQPAFTLPHTHLFNLLPTPWATQPQNFQHLSNTQDIPAEPMGPPINKRKRKAPTLRADAWEPYKDRIVELHVTQNLPLPKVKDIIQEEFGFTAEYVCS